MNNPKFSWGEYVLIKQMPDNESLVGELASICGISEIKYEQMSKQYDLPVGAYVYTVEVNNGESYVLPEGYLKKEL